MRVGYCSPFNPLKSGISDFSEELVVALSEQVEIVVFSPVKIKKQNIVSQYETHLISELNNEKLRNSLDLIVYHVGNNAACHGEIVDMLIKYPGVLELHDFGLHHMAAEKYLIGQGADSYLKEVRYCHGTYGEKIALKFLDGKSSSPWETHPLDMCMNKRYIDCASAMIVHSEAVKQMVLGIRSDVPITNIMLHSEEIISSPKEWSMACRKKLDLPQGKLICGMFGFATSTKRVIPILTALKRYKQKKSTDFLYIIVGEPQRDLRIENVIAEYGLEDNVHVTGFTDLERFKTYMGACDFCMNLRYPTQGESSASLHRMLGMGKPAIVTEIGTFSDYPDDVVLKVRYDEHEVDDIYRVFSLLAGNKKELQKRSKAALNYAKTYCDLEKNAKRYAEFFQQIHDHTWQPEYEDTLITKLCELGLTDEAYTEHIYSNILV